MSGSTNFLQFDSTKTNILSDNDYAGSTAQLNGVSSGVAVSQLHNKIFYQASTFITAFSTVFANLGYTVSDSNINYLGTILANVIAINQSGGINAKNQQINNTLAGVSSGDAVNMGQFSASKNMASGYQRLPSGIMIQWGTATGNSSAIVNITFPAAFTTNPVVFGWYVSVSTVPLCYTTTNAVTTGATLFVQNAGGTNAPNAPTAWLAIGY
jgi:hypothetical protein